MSESKAANLPVRMERPDLDGLPQWPLTEGYSVRWFAEGDVETWVSITEQADPFNRITPLLHRNEFGRQNELLNQRQCFLYTSNGQAVGTASAWFDKETDGDWGRIHWVAMLPEFQGRGLAKPLMTTVCNWLRELGHERAYLMTSTARVAAIQLYLKCGFKPAIRSDGDYGAWAEYLGVGSEF